MLTSFLLCQDKLRWLIYQESTTSILLALPRRVSEVVQQQLARPPLRLQNPQSSPDDESSKSLVTSLAPRPFQCFLVLAVHQQLAALEISLQ
jgi:hypothetical protein